MTALCGGVFTSCDDDYDPYYPGYNGYEMASSPIRVAPLGPAVITPSDPDFRDIVSYYHDAVYLFNSLQEVYSFFNPDELAAYPEITRVDYNRFTVLVYTVYQPYYIVSYQSSLRWLDDGWSGNPALYVNFLYTNQPLPPGGLCLGQVAMVIDKMWDSRGLTVTYDLNPY